LTSDEKFCHPVVAEHRMRVKSEIVFPNNIRELRQRKQLTQAQLGRAMEPPVGESTISKMESGERRLTNLQLANLATILGCQAEEIPVVPNRDPSRGVQRWQRAQQEAVQHSVESGAAAAGYVLAQLRKKSGKTMQQVASTIGMALSVYHRVEMASRVLQADEGRWEMGAARGAGTLCYAPQHPVCCTTQKGSYPACLWPRQSR
jgi:transcriptional regulator with XRE-family HTH domain